VIGEEVLVEKADISMDALESAIQKQTGRMS